MNGRVNRRLKGRRDGCPRKGLPPMLNGEQMARPCATYFFWLHKLQCQCAWSKLVTRMFLLAVEQRRAKDDLATGCCDLHLDSFGWCFKPTFSRPPGQRKFSGISEFPISSIVMLVSVFIHLPGRTIRKK